MTNEVQKAQIAGLPITRENVNGIVNSFMYAVEQGDVPALDVHLLAKLLIDIGNGLKGSDVILDKAISEAGLWQKQVYRFNWIPAVSKPRDSWEYDDPALAELKAKVKSREQFLQKLEKPMVDPETGEEIQPAKRKPGKNYITWSEPR
jgi:hypothetical protein